MTRTQWPQPRIVTLDEVGSVGPALSEGQGQSLSISPLIDHPGYLVKLYKTPGGSAESARLDRLIALVDNRSQDADTLRTRTSWPVARITSADGACLGCVIPRAPARFQVIAGAGPAPKRSRYLDVDLLAKPAEALAKRGLPVPSAQDRLAICRELASVAASLERLGLVYSDWSYSNAFWSAQGAEAFVIDIDGCAVGSGPNICQPNWEDPLTPRARPADTYVERFRVALLVARCLTGKRPLAEVLRALDAPSDRRFSGAVAEVLLDMLLAVRREDRPSIATLQAVLADGPYVVVPDRRRPVPQLTTQIATPAVSQAPPDARVSLTRPWAGARTFWTAALVTTLLVAAVLAGGYVWTRTKYAVGVRNGKVVVFQGVDYHAVGVDLRHIVDSTDIPADLVLDTSRTALVHGIPAQNQADADRIVATLRAQASVCAATLGSGCPARPGIVPASFTVSPATYPHGNEVTISWAGVDSRRNAVTSLRVDGSSPPSGCPAVITQSGRCTFQGDWAHTYDVLAEVSAPDVDTVSTPVRVATTYAQPSLAVTPGGKFTKDGTEYCYIDVTVAGFAPSTSYTVTLGTDSEATTYNYTVQTDTSGAGTMPENLGYSDPAGTGWASATVDGMTVTRNPWACS